MTMDRIFILGGTGNIGTRLVQDLLKKKASITLYSRNPSKVASLFPDNDIHVIEGDIQDVNKLKDAMQGHTRLFLLLGIQPGFSKTKRVISEFAYRASIKQIVDISSITSGYPWRTTHVGDMYVESEKAILDIPNRGTYVALRPGRFMSNVLVFERLSPDGIIYDTADQDMLQGWISPNDIGSIVANILTDPIEKHGDGCYELIGDTITPKQRADIFSRVLNRSVVYEQMSALAKYNLLTKLGTAHLIAYDLCTQSSTRSPYDRVSTGIPILLNRDPETFEQFVQQKKDLLAI
ncbi:uncharacterized protein B0P05DRAFT_246973 [Gilbertella persicaria]|uniref:uncharacterized protein n=1 Tax=Gilbertella persicaria TaxID=101096 RepID=UPI0022201521|nr:uncharacterized protein B0P05DRAFT_246973 [Gilbertella persicaria]KAI8062359.1 hypothetical protein B0P05DRAFT_246973 [Gilbertella persicaria]